MPPVTKIGDGGSPVSPKAAKFMEVARKRFKTAQTAWAKVRAEQLYDKKFRAGEQWEPDHKASRDADKRPCLVINRLPGIMRQVINQATQMKPGIQVNPVDSKADPATAEVLQGIIRNIEINSDVDAAYGTGQTNQTEIGIGWWRILTEYADDESFDQVLKIKRVRNPFAVWPDPSANEADFRDMKFLFHVEEILREEFEAIYGADKARDLDLFEGNLGPDWCPIGKVRIAEYYYVDLEEDELVLLELPPDQTHPVAWRLAIPAKDVPNNIADLGVRVVQKRKIIRHKVRWAKINGYHILDGNESNDGGRDWPGIYIPYIPCVGEEIDINGEVDYRGMVRDARGPSRMLNFWASSIAEAVGTAPRPPYIAEAGQIAGLEAWWDNLNRRNFTYLPYRAKSVDGRLVPAPQRQTAEPPIQAMVQGYVLTQNELRDVTGLHEPNMGEMGNERSGKAILARQQRGDLGTSNYLNNFARAIRFTGEQLVDLIPKVYDAQRMLRILGAEGQQPRMVMVHSGNPPANPEQIMGTSGLAGIYDLSVGKYDVSISLGPSFQSRRQESVEAMTAMVQSYPQAFAVIGDLLVGNMDWPGAPEIAKRLRKMLPPNLQDGDVGSLPPEAQAAISQLTGQLQQLQAQYQQAQQILATEAQKLAAQVQMTQIEAMSKERIAAVQAQVDGAKIQADLVKTQAQLNADRAESLLKAEVEKITTMMELAMREAEAREAESTESEGVET